MPESKTREAGVHIPQKDRSLLAFFEGIDFHLRDKGPGAGDNTIRQRISELSADLHSRGDFFNAHAEEYLRLFQPVNGVEFTDTTDVPTLFDQVKPTLGQLNTDGKREALEYLVHDTTRSIVEKRQPRSAKTKRTDVTTSTKDAASVFLGKLDEVIMERIDPTPEAGQTQFDILMKVPVRVTKSAVLLYLASRLGACTPTQSTISPDISPPAITQMVPAIETPSPTPVLVVTPLPTEQITPTPLPGGPPTEMSSTEVPPTPVVVTRENLQDVRIDSVLFLIDPNDPDSAAPNVIAQYREVVSRLTEENYHIVASSDELIEQRDVWVVGVQDGQGNSYGWTIAAITKDGVLWSATGRAGISTLLGNPADMRSGVFDHFEQITDGYGSNVVRNLELVNGAWTYVVRDTSGNFLAFYNTTNGEFWYNLNADTLPNDETLMRHGIIPPYNTDNIVDSTEYVVGAESRGIQVGFVEIYDGFIGLHSISIDTAMQPWTFLGSADNTSIEGTQLLDFGVRFQDRVIIIRGLGIVGNCILLNHDPNTNTDSPMYIQHDVPAYSQDQQYRIYFVNAAPTGDGPQWYEVPRLCSPVCGEAFGSLTTPDNPDEFVDMIIHADPNLWSEGNTRTIEYRNGIPVIDVTDVFIVFRAKNSDGGYTP